MLLAINFILEEDQEELMEGAGGACSVTGASFVSVFRLLLLLSGRNEVFLDLSFFEDSSSSVDRDWIDEDENISGTGAVSTESPS